MIDMGGLAGLYLPVIMVYNRKNMKQVGQSDEKRI